MPEQPTVPHHPAPGPGAGALLGVPAGLLLGWLWVAKDADVAVAVSLVFAGLVAAVGAGAPDWRGFALGMLATGVLVSVVLLWAGS